MANSIFTRQEYLTSNVKSKLISTYIGKELSKSFQRSFECELLQKSFTKENPDEMSTILSKSFENTRPSSVNSFNRFKTNEKPACRKLDSNIPSSYKASLQALQERLHTFDESQRDQNTDYLLFSFLLIFTGIWEKSLENPVLSFLQANIWNSFREIISKNDFCKKLRMIPRMIRSKKASQEDLKKSLSWFCMIKPAGLETLQDLYEFVRETFVYARKFYFFSIILPEGKGSKTEAKTGFNRTSNFNLTGKKELCLTRPENRKGGNKENDKGKSLNRALEKKFSVFWENRMQNKTSDTKECIFKEFKAQCKTLLGTESSLFILKRISDKLKNSE